MNTLLILAHGSRKKESNDEVIRLAESLDQTPDTGFAKVLCAFNQFSGPSVAEQFQKLAEMGAKKITVLPYFIAGGSHVLSDIPELVNQARLKFPGITFFVTPHFGAFKGVKNMILNELSGG